MVIKFPGTETRETPPLLKPDVWKEAESTLVHLFLLLIVGDSELTLYIFTLSIFSTYPHFKATAMQTLVDVFYTTEDLAKKNAKI